MSTMDGLVMSLSDVAALAEVRRPVVTVWRGRLRRAGADEPFPAPVGVGDGAELFSAADVVDWLERTRRGNNPEPRADLAAHVRLPAVSGAHVTPVDAAEALLCLLVGSDTSVSGRSAEDLLDLAEELDPDDDFLFREVETAGDDAATVATYVERVVDASFGVEGALAVLDRRRPRSGAMARLNLSTQAHDLIGEISAALALDLVTDTVTLDDATGGGADLVEAVTSTLGERVDIEVIVRGDTPRARSARRRQIIQRRRLRLAGGPSRLILARYPHADRPTMTPGQVLDAVDRLQLELTETDRAVVVGPAAVLCDALADKAEEAIRDNVLRLGRLRCAVRLPKGLVTASPRRALGLWVLGPEAQAMPLDQRLTMTADLADVPLTGTVVSELATDVVASLESRQSFHGFRFARPARTSQLLARGGRLVGVGSGRTPRKVTASEEVLMLRRLARAAGLEDEVRIEPGAGPGVSTVTIADALASGEARLVAGTRLSAEPLPVGSLRLLGASALAEGGAATTVDALELTRRHPRAPRTEPGDVVFVTTPRPRALVDEEGLSVVAYPARVLRFGPASGVVPLVAARAINALPDGARTWRGWLVPRVAEDQVTQVAGVLRRIEAESGDLRRRLTALAEIGDRVGAAVGDGSARVSLDIAQQHGNNDVMQYEESAVRR